MFNAIGFIDLWDTLKRIILNDSIRGYTLFVSRPISRPECLDFWKRVIFKWSFEIHREYLQYKRLRTIFSVKFTQITDCSPTKLWG